MDINSGIAHKCFQLTYEKGNSSSFPLLPHESSLFSLTAQLREQHDFLPAYQAKYLLIILSFAHSLVLISNPSPRPYISTSLLVLEFIKFSPILSLPTYFLRILNQSQNWSPCFQFKDMYNLYILSKSSLRKMGFGHPLA